MAGDSARPDQLHLPALRAENEIGFIEKFALAPEGSPPRLKLTVPLPFFSEANAPLWHAGIGYEVAGILGILAVGGVTYLVALLLRGAERTKPPISAESTT